MRHRVRPAGPAGGIAVVGAAGFLGSALVTAADRAGVRVARYTRATPFLTAAGVPDRGLAAARTVFWLASRVTPARAESDPELVRADREAFAALLGALHGLPEPARVVLLSSGGTVYDPAAPPPYRESAPTRPRGAYGRAKLELEAALAAAGLPAGRTVTLRVSNVYGPGQPAVSGQGVIGYWLRAAATGGQLTVYGDLASTRDYVHVDDVAAAMLAVHRAPAGLLPPVLNVGSGAGTSLRELVDTVQDVVGDPTLRWDLRPAREFDVPHTWLDVRLARDVLGWAATTRLRDGLAGAWRSVRHGLSALDAAGTGTGGPR